MLSKVDFVGLVWTVKERAVSLLAASCGSPSTTSNNKEMIRDWMQTTCSGASIIDWYSHQVCYSSNTHRQEAPSPRW